MPLLPTEPVPSKELTTEDLLLLVAKLQTENAALQGKAAAPVETTEMIWPNPRDKEGLNEATVFGNTVLERHKDYLVVAVPVHKFKANQMRSGKRLLTPKQYEALKELEKANEIEDLDDE